MTRQTPAWLQQPSYNASADRLLLQALWPIGSSSGCVVSVATLLTVNISAGQVAVPTANGTGTTLCTSDAVEQVTLPAANATNPRIDLITCQARGNDLDGGANNDFIFTSVQGTPAASPVAPATPAGQVAIAQVLVPAAATTLLASNILDLATGNLTGMSGAVNLLTAEDSSFEGGSVGAWAMANATFVNSTAQAAVGTHSLQVTCTNSAANWYGYVNNFIAVTPGSMYQAAAAFRPSTTARSMQVGIWWFDSTGTNIATTTGSVTEVAGGWATATATGGAPPTAVKVQVLIAAPVIPSGEIHFVDNIALYCIAGWTPSLAQPGYAEVSGTAPSASGPASITPPNGLLWVDTSTTIASAPYVPSQTPPVSGTNSFTDTAGEIWVSRNGSAWRKARDVLHARYARAASWPIPTTYAPIPWDTTVYDAYAMLSGATDIILPVAGFYWVAAEIQMGLTSNPAINLWIDVGGTHIVNTYTQFPTTTFAVQMSIVASVQRSAGDHLQISMVSTGTGGTIGTAQTNYVSVSYLGNG